MNGFDERFRRAYREDADIALRVFDAGYRIEKGSRSIQHPVRPPIRGSAFVCKREMPTMR